MRPPLSETRLQEIEIFVGKPHSIPDRACFKEQLLMRTYLIELLIEVKELRREQFYLQNPKGPTKGEG